MTEKWSAREVEETSVDLRKYSIKDTGGKSRKKYKDPPEGMYECKRLMTVAEANDVYRDRCVWRSVLSDYPAKHKAWS